MLDALLQSIVNNQNLINENGYIAELLLDSDRENEDETSDFYKALEVIVEPEGASEEFYEAQDRDGLESLVIQAMSGTGLGNLTHNAVQLARYVDTFGY